MTPMAQRIVRSEAVKDDRFKGLLSSDCRCFEVSAVIPMMRDLFLIDEWDTKRERLAFLPAPLTWIEWYDPTGEIGEMPRVGLMLTAYEPGDRIDIGLRGDARSGILSNVVTADQPGYMVRAAWEKVKANAPGIMLGPAVRVQASEAGGVVFLMPPNMDNDQRRIAANMARMAVAALALINAPRIIGRRWHLPHAGLQRELARKRKMVGKFPLHAWTEIVLEVTPPKEARGEYEAHLTGGRALHFCRAHLRLRCGQIEFVRHHWRGDPSLGIKRSRYTVTSPKPRPRHGAVAA